jgi:mono/diheme cytochrome c family protein
MKNQITILSVIPIIFTLGLQLLHQTKEYNQNSNTETNERYSLPSDRVTEPDEALVLMHVYCYACHTHESVGGRDNRLGPPMFRVRDHYYNENISREEFVQNIVEFVQNPVEEKIKMPGAVRNFGLMPPLMIKSDDLEQIAGYIFDRDLTSKEWILKWEAYKKTFE